MLSEAGASLYLASSCKNKKSTNKILKSEENFVLAIIAFLYRIFNYLLRTSSSRLHDSIKQGHFRLFSDMWQPAITKRSDMEVASQDMSTWTPGVLSLGHGSLVILPSQHQPTDCIRCCKAWPTHSCPHTQRAWSPRLGFVHVVFSDWNVSSTPFPYLNLIQYNTIRLSVCLLISLRLSQAHIWSDLFIL